MYSSRQGSRSGPGNFDAILRTMVRALGDSCIVCVRGSAGQGACSWSGSLVAGLLRHVRSG